ncbi:11027_t:CDS:2, partial [Dentiscutata erythropus]
MATNGDMGSKETFQLDSMQSKFDEIRDKIEQELQGQDTGIIKIKFPVKELKELSDLNVREKIHNAFNAERIGFDLFIK